MLQLKSIFTLSFIMLMVLISGCVMDNPEITIEEEEFLNLSYGNNVYQQFDLFLPANRSQATTNVLVLVHGGGWIEGDKQDISGFYDYFKGFSDDFAIANINYRLGDLTDSPLPMQMEDIAAFIEFFKKNAESYQVNPSFSFFGISAGAHLSMLYSYSYDLNQDIKVVCNMVGPTDFLDDLYVQATDSVTIDLFNNVQVIMGLPIDGNESYYESISPKYLVNNSTVPTISFYGGEDLLVPEEQGELLRDELNLNGISNEYFFYPDGGHGWGEPDIFDTLDKVLSFSKEHM